MSCRRQLLVKLARIAAVRPPRGLPTKREFLRLSKCFDNRNYVQFRIMHSAAVKSEIVSLFIGRSGLTALMN